MGKSKHLELTAGDVEVFRWLWMLRVLTLEQIRRLRYFQPESGRLSSRDNVRKRLKRLWDAGYLVGDRLLTSERIYFLGQQALIPLQDHYGIDQRRVYRPRSAQTMQQLLHPLLVSECAVRFIEAVRQTTTVKTPELPPLWVPFYHTHAVADARRRKHVERFVTQEDVWIPGKPAPHRIRPDLVFALTSGGVPRLFLLEADRGTESPAIVAEKQLAYSHYRTARDPEDPSRFLFQRYGDVHDFRVLFVTVHSRRIDLLRQRLRSQPGFDLMAFTTSEELRSKDPVFEPIWRIANGTICALTRSEMT